MKAMLVTQYTIHCSRTHTTGEQLTTGNRTHVSIIRCHNSLLFASRCMFYKTHLYCLLATSNPVPRLMLHSTYCDTLLFMYLPQFCGLHPLMYTAAVSGAAPHGTAPSLSSCPVCRLVPIRSVLHFSDCDM
jgi:hypothetical protein